MTRSEREQLVLAHYSWSLALVRRCEWIRRDIWPDLHQEALMVMWRRTLRYRHGRWTFAAFVRLDVEHAIRREAKRMKSPAVGGSGGDYRQRSPAMRQRTAPFPPGLSTGSTPEDILAAQDRPRILARAIRDLPLRERVVLDGRLAGRTVTELAARLRVSHQRVCQLWGQGVRRVRAAI